MRTLYLECNMGAAGDMLMGALYEICPQSVREEFLIVMNDLFPDVTVAVETVEKNGIQGTHICVLIDGKEEMSHEHHSLHNYETYLQEEHSKKKNIHVHEHHTHEEHPHEHHTHEEHFHEHHTHEEHPHEHHSLMDIHSIIASMNISEAVKEKACEIYTRIAAAEGHAHGREMTEIHFHEVGTRDAVVDVVGFCWLIDKLAPEKIIASAVCTGYGHVHCAHGILPVPAPATAFLLQGIPCYAGDIEGELCTPTGAAILGAFVDEFGPMPCMITEGIGYGMGRKEFKVLNCVRSFIGNQVEDAGMKSRELEITKKDSGLIKINSEIIELNCNIDDMTAEELGFAIDLLREKGALEVYTTAVQMKKSRSGYVLTCLCKQEQEPVFVEMILKYTSTIGIRRKKWERYEMERSVATMDTQYGTVRVKVSKGFGIEKRKLEYEDIARIAKEQDISIRALQDMISL